MWNFVHIFAYIVETSVPAAPYSPSKNSLHGPWRPSSVTP